MEIKEIVYKLAGTKNFTVDKYIRYDRTRMPSSAYVDGEWRPLHFSDNDEKDEMQREKFARWIKQIESTHPQSQPEERPFFMTVTGPLTQRQYLAIALYQEAGEWYFPIRLIDLDLDELTELTKGIEPFYLGELVRAGRDKGLTKQLVEEQKALLLKQEEEDEKWRRECEETSAKIRQDMHKRYERQRQEEQRQQEVRQGLLKARKRAEAQERAIATINPAPPVEEDETNNQHNKKPGHVIGTTSDNAVIELPYSQRTKGVAIIGKTGYGKSTLLSHMVQQDIQSGTTAIVLDPHGDLCKSIIQSTPKRYEDRLVYLPIDPDYPFGMNLFQVANPTDPIQADNAVDGVQQILKKLMGSEQVYLRTDRVIRAIAYTLVEQQGYTMADIIPLLTNKKFRQKVVANVTDPVTHAFWEEYEESYNNLMIRRDMVDPVMNRISMFMDRRFVRRILSQEETTLDFTKILNSHKTHLISLPVGTLGAGITELLGTIILFQLANAIYARAETNERPRIHLYVDEFHRFTLSNITASLLKEGRKFGLGTTIALQVLSDLKDEENRNALFQTGTLITFQAIGTDADILAKQFSTEGAPPKDYKEEPVKVLSNDPFGYLVYSGMGHSNPEIADLTSAILIPIANDMEVRRKSHHEGQYVPHYEQRRRIVGYTGMKSDGTPEWGFIGKHRPIYEDYTYDSGGTYYRPEKETFELKHAVAALLADVHTGRLPFLPFSEDSPLSKRLFTAVKLYLKTFHRKDISEQRIDDLNLYWREKPLDEPFYFIEDYFYPPKTQVHLAVGNICSRETAERAGEFLEGLFELCKLLRQEENKIYVRSEQTQLVPIPRLVSDIQAEIANMIATLYPFTALCKLTQEEDVLEAKAKLLPPPPTPRPHASEEVVRQAGRSLFGRAWSELKEHIPGLKPREVEIEAEATVVEEDSYPESVKLLPMPVIITEVPPARDWEEE